MVAIPVVTLSASNRTMLFMAANVLLKPHRPCMAEFISVPAAALWIPHGAEH